MNQRARSLLSALALASAAAVACEKASPARPSSSEGSSASAVTVTDAASGITFVAPQPVSPARNANVKFSSQPLTLTVANGVATSTGAATYTFEVASDTGFASKVYTKDGVAEGSGRTSLAIDKLAGAKTYYWRARMTIGGTSGPYSPVSSFALGPEVILQTPTLASPGDGQSAFAPVRLSVNNVGRSGPAGVIKYQFDVATSNNFSSVLYTTTVDEQGGGQTAITMPSSIQLTDGGTYFWRVRASDPDNAVTTAFSAVESFKAQSFNWRTAIIHDNPPDLGSWPRGATITSVDFAEEAMYVDFDRRDGPNRWPDVAFGSGDIQYTLGLCLNIGGQWHCSAVVQFWYGRDLAASGIPSRFWREWWYDGARWGAMGAYHPEDGETVGVFVAAGNLRFDSYTLATCPRVCEVSDVVMMPFANHGGSSYRAR